MYDIYSQTKNFTPVILIGREENGIKALLCTSVISESSGVKGWLTKRSIVVGGPLLSGVNAKEFLPSYDKYIKDICIYSRISNVFDMSKELEGIESLGYEFQKHLNFLVDLTQDENVLWERMHNTRRRQIKRAYRRGLTVKVHDAAENFAEYYDILKANYDRNNLPIHDYSYFERAYNILAAKKYIKFFSAYSGDKLVAHRMVLLYKDRIYDWFAGSLEEASSLYPNDVLVWEVLKWGNNNNYKLFDFGGAGDPDKEYGVRDFKRKFGGDEVCFGNYMKIHQPNKYRLLKTAISAYNKIKKQP